MPRNLFADGFVTVPRGSTFMAARGECPMCKSDRCKEGPNLGRMTPYAGFGVVPEHVDPEEQAMQQPVENKAIGLTPRQSKDETPAERSDGVAAENIAKRLSDEDE